MFLRDIYSSDVDLNALFSYKFHSIDTENRRYNEDGIFIKWKVIIALTC